MPYVPRQLSGVLADIRARFPAVLVTGPRQSGKTTFLRHEAPDCGYVTFDDPLNRQFAARDPHGFLDQFGTSPVVLDEVQYGPDLFPYLKMRIDADRSVHGRYLLTGSQQFAMMRHVGESLAGRLALRTGCGHGQEGGTRAPRMSAKSGRLGGAGISPSPTTLMR